MQGSGGDFPGATVRRDLEEVLRATHLHNVWRRKECINLIPSENVMSRLAEVAYMSDMMSRYAEGKPGKRFYQGVNYMDEVEVLDSRLMSELSGSSFSDVRPISGTVANAAVFRSLAGCGDKALVAPVQAGAHVSHTKFGTLGALGMVQEFMPYDSDAMNVDVDGAIRMIYEAKPKIVVLGGSLYLFPHPVKELAPHVKAVGSTLVYDAAHVYGLIAGGAWRNPLSEGADVMTASTHKTFPGPQGGLISSSEEQKFKAAYKGVFPWFVSNHHLHRLPALVITALEMKAFGRAYAAQVTSNAKILAQALSAEGFKVVGERLGFTRSHQVALDASKIGGGAKAALELEKAGIIVNKNMLPWDSPDMVDNPSGIRMGTQEMTRYGMKEDEMREVAALMRSLLLDAMPAEEVKRKVVALRAQFLQVGYSLDADLSELSSSSLPLLMRGKVRLRRQAEC